MTIRLVLAVIFLAAGARSAWQGWNSYRRHRVGVSVFQDDSMTREEQPGIYWPAMVLLAALVMTFLSIAATLAFGLWRHSH